MSRRIETSFSDSLEEAVLDGNPVTEGSTSMLVNVPPDEGRRACRHVHGTVAKSAVITAEAVTHLTQCQPLLINPHRLYAPWSIMSMAGGG